MRIGRHRIERSKVVAVSAGALILLLGLGLNLLFTALREPPALAPPRPITLQVEAIEAQPETVPVEMIGYGQTRSLNVVPISAEVSGRVVSVHPNLRVGGLIPAGETMFEIDSSDYEARLAEATANVEMSRQAIERLQHQYAADQNRLQTFERSRDLARAEFERLRILFEQDEVGTRSAVEQAERAYNAAADQVDQIEQALKVYPVSIQEAENALAAAQARRGQAQVALERTVVRAPFNARVQTVTLEENQYVAPGANILTLADDSILEISVPLDSREVRNWMRFAQNSQMPVDAWFRDVEPVPVEIRWTEDLQGHVWQGNLHRVERFDEQTRTVTVAVRISGENARNRHPAGLPLVQDMFCEVRIPGEPIEKAYRIPAVAVSFDGRAYTAVDGRLRTVQLTRVLDIGDYAIITDGLEPGDIVITTRLVNPLENTPLEIVNLTPAAGASEPAGEAADGAQGAS